MTLDEIKAALDIPDAYIRPSDTEGWYWINVSREHGGQRYSHTVRLELDASAEQVNTARQAIVTWWNETIAE